MPAQLVTLEQITCRPDEARQRIADNWQTVVTDVADAAKASGRAADSVRIVGVSKYVDAAITQWLVEAGCHDLGENRPQLLGEKATFLQGSSLDGPITWHQIGHLQRNKVRRLLKAQPVIHSVDSERLLDEILSEAASQNLNIEAMIELNISGEEAKTGLAVDDVRGLLERFVRQNEAADTSPVRIVGLMAMAGWGTEMNRAKQQFANLRKLRDELERTSGLKLPELSMGMSGDFPAAVGEGATMVRIGSKLFDGVLPR